MGTGMGMDGFRPFTHSPVHFRIIIAMGNIQNGLVAWMGGIHLKSTMAGSRPGNNISTRYLLAVAHGASIIAIGIEEFTEFRIFLGDRVLSSQG